MSCILNIEQIGEGARKLATINEDDILIGRSPAPSGIAIRSGSVSSTHGMFFRNGHAWFYRDLNSTNGSFVNGRQLSANMIHLIKSGDVLRLSNTELKLDIEFSDPSVMRKFRNPHLYVFWHDKYMSVINMTAKPYSVGGSTSSVVIPGQFTRHHAISTVVDHEGGKLIVEKAKDWPMLNGQQQVVPVEIKMEDRDIVQIGALAMLYNAGYSNEDLRSSSEVAETYIEPDASYRKKTIANGSFGKVGSAVEDEFSEKIKTAGLLDGSGFVTDDVEVNEDRLIYMVAFVALVIAFLLLIWFIVF